MEPFEDDHDLVKRSVLDGDEQHPHLHLNLVQRSDLNIDGDEDGDNHLPHLEEVLQQLEEYDHRALFKRSVDEKDGHSGEHPHSHKNEPDLEESLKDLLELSAERVSKKE